VVPEAIPVTVPELLTEPTPGNVELHVPPGTTSLRDATPPPSQAIGTPDIAPGVTGSGFTVTTIVAATEPQPLVFV